MGQYYEETYLNYRSDRLVHEHYFRRDFSQHDDPFHTICVDCLTVLRDYARSEQFPQLRIIAELECHLFASLALNRHVDNCESGWRLNHHHVSRIRHQYFVQVYAIFNVVRSR